MSGANIFNNVAYGSAIVLPTSNYSVTGSIIVSCTASNYALVVNYGTGGSGMSVNSASLFQAVRVG